MPKRQYPDFGKASDEEKKEGLEFIEVVFKKQDFNDKGLIEAERDKTPEELIIIDLVNNATNEIRKKYGLEKRDIPSKNIHILKKDSFFINDEEGSDTHIHGVFQSKHQRILIGEGPVRIMFMKNLFHEMLHFKSYNSLQVENVNHSVVKPYRSGLSVISRDCSTGYLYDINEAVTEELTKRFSSDLCDNPLFAKEIEETKKSLSAHSTYVDGKPLPSDFYEDVFYAENSKFGLIDFTYSYKEERDALQLLIDKLFERNKEEFGNREEIFEMFAKGFMTGNILPLGKLIDRTFGKRTLRKIGDNSKNTYKIIDSL